MSCALQGPSGYWCMRADRDRNQPESVRPRTHKEAPPPTADDQRRAAAERDELREDVTQARARVDKLAVRLDELQAQLGADEVKLRAGEELHRKITTQLQRATQASSPSGLPRFMLMGEIIGTEPDGRLYIYCQMPLQESGPQFTQALFRSAVLTDPRPGDLIMGRMANVRGVYFRGYMSGRNGFGGPTTAAVFSHAPPAVTKAMKVAQQEAAKLKVLADRTQFEISKLDATVQPLRKARESLEVAQAKLAKAERQLADLPATTATE